MCLMCQVCLMCLMTLCNVFDNDVLRSLVCLRVSEVRRVAIFVHVIVNELPLVPED